MPLSSIITQWIQTLSEPVTFEYISAGKSEQNDQMATFSQWVCDNSNGMVTCKTSKGEDNIPAFVTESGIRFHALPGSKQLPLFLAALNRSAPPLTGQSLTMAETLTLPVVLDLFVAESCPFCPQITAQLIALAQASNLVSLRIFDGTFFPETAAQKKVMSAPTLIYDNQLRWSGQFELAAAMEMMVGRPPEELSADALRGMLEEGEASRVAAMVARAGCPFQGLNTLLSHEKWSVRLGAMVVMEELSETHPDIVSETAALLLDAAGNMDPSTLGDVVYIAGLSKDPVHVGRLEALKAISESEDLSEAIDEALEEIDTENPS